MLHRCSTIYLVRKFSFLAQFMLASIGGLPQCMVILLIHHPTLLFARFQVLSSTVKVKVSAKRSGI